MVDARFIGRMQDTAARGIGKAGKGALAGIHPQQQLAANGVARARQIVPVINTADFVETLSGAQFHSAAAAAAISGRMSGARCGYTYFRASGVHARSFLRFPGSPGLQMAPSAHGRLRGSRDRRRAPR